MLDDRFRLHLLLIRLQRLDHVARSILPNDAEAEDVMQDAYVRAYEHLNQFAGEAKFSTWRTGKGEAVLVPCGSSGTSKSWLTLAMRIHHNDGVG